jgi:hypothetical protein
MLQKADRAEILLRKINSKHSVARQSGMHALRVRVDINCQHRSEPGRSTYPGTWDGQGRTTQWQPCCGRWSAKQQARRQAGHESVTKVQDRSICAKKSEQRALLASAALN